ncbi:RNA-binding S4 domain-containing protein [Jeongeupia sp. USM3]|uniref:RNA-binding S4 domain-containing protein n=1 Tax=Jeongeupia sp. USM3 TaxID=1906741 RepID=UPI00089E00F8|nr:RNA-binding S4 domain-containing protein [Jeongeupia sp. USM3]AOY02098.1 RNA-binding protein [Jeongeupia sp. USM3]
MPVHDEAAAKVRLDKWLWAARFYKTRSLATEAIDAGHVHLNGDRAKPARTVKAGDRLRVLTAHGEFDVVVAQLSDRRGPAEVARTLYDETPESEARRAQQSLDRALVPTFEHPLSKGRPTKKWRRQLHDFSRKQQG